MLTRTFFSILLVFACFSAAWAQNAGDFRVDNEVRVVGQDTAVKSVTYFLGNDFLSIIGDNGEITFHDAARDTFVLLDPVLRVQTHLSATRSREEVDKQRELHQSHDIPYLAFVSKPKFTTEFDETSGKIALQSPWFDYLLSTTSFPDTETARRYLDHCDWSCYLNHRINRSLVPLVRLEVNRILREKQSFPLEIAFSHFPKGKGLLAKEEKIRSSHQLVRRLGDQDSRKIEQAREYRRVFTAIPFEQYQEKVEQKNRESARK